MRFYCETCGTEFIIGAGVNLSELLEDGLECYFDWQHGNMIRIQDYETPAQYKTRTGKPYPDDGPVWVWDSKWKGEWVLCRWRAVNNEQWLAKTENIVVIANPPVPPPLEWRPV